MPVTIAAGPLRLPGLTAISVIVTDLTGEKRYQDLQDVDRRKDEFLAMLAHELRNPLAPISNAVQALCLSDPNPESELRQTCDVINRQVQQLAAIVDDLLDVSRITRGKIALHLKPVEVSDVVMRAIETSRPLIESCGHSLRTSLPAQALRVEGDEARLSQAVTNLLNNAAKYTDRGGEILVTVAREGSDALIKVRDTGVGLSKEMLSSVFDLFMQAERSIDRSQGGLGIGLTLVRSLVELHKGSVSAASDGPGTGSEFTIRLPLLTQPAVPAPSAVRAPAAGSTSRRILIVDDNQDSARTLAMLMKISGHETFLCFDGAVRPRSRTHLPARGRAARHRPARHERLRRRREAAAGARRACDGAGRPHGLRSRRGPPPIPRGRLRSSLRQTRQLPAAQEPDRFARGVARKAGENAAGWPGQSVVRLAGLRQQRRCLIMDAQRE